jgi:hypothetical protein
MTHCITLYASNNDVRALIQLGLKLGRSPGWIVWDLHDDNVNELVEITLEFASKEDAASFSEDFTGCSPRVPTQRSGRASADRLPARR